uniref:Uncharacterized protein n=1 Tax=Physcomitrium patens TaxID=3218 RepID=A0A7I3ZA18_PHYPA
MFCHLISPSCAATILPPLHPQTLVQQIPLCSSFETHSPRRIDATFYRCISILSKICLQHRHLMAPLIIEGESLCLQPQMEPYTDV